MNKIKVATMTRTAVLILALANQILSATGHSLIPVDDAQLEQLISTGMTVGAAIWAWWKNNSFTKEAIAADNYLDSLIGRKEK
jgi:SPP1 family holin|nr:MAG TPA: holin [Caudoviricetes sp.]